MFSHPVFRNFLPYGFPEIIDKSLKAGGILKFYLNGGVHFFQDSRDCRKKGGGYVLDILLNGVYGFGKVDGVAEYEGYAYGNTPFKNVAKGKV